LALTSPTSGGRSVGIVHWRTKAPEFFYDELKGDETDGHVTYVEEERNVYKALGGKYEGKRPLEIPRRS
jgi:hypothetical protein